MIPRELLATASVPGGQELRLVRRGQDFMILLDRNELMNSRMSGSEEALATMTCERLAGREAPHLLVGGYGMGFTLRAALAVLDARARVTVAEIVPEIVDWARGPMEEMTAGGLDDPRTALALRDVADVIAAGSATYDAILLDVDNGPDGLSRAGNNRLYSARGLAAAKAALRPAVCWRSGPPRPMRRSRGGWARRASPSTNASCARARTARARATSSGSRRERDGMT